MRIIIDCDPEMLDDALARAKREVINGLERYHKPGWGWRFGPFFVRAIKGGISVHQRGRDTASSATP